MALGSVASAAAAPRIGASLPYGGYYPGGAPTATAQTAYPTFTPPTLPQSVSGSYTPSASVAALFKTPTTSGGVDYTKQLADDYLLQQGLTGIKAQGPTDAAQLTAAQQTALARYGEIPTDLKGTLGVADVRSADNPFGTGYDPNAALSQVTQDLAAEATKGGVSTVAQIAKAYADQQAADNNSLAARGMLRSGALGQHYQSDLNARNFASYNATNSLLDYLTGQYQNFLGQRGQMVSQASDATNQALSRIIAQIQAGLGGPPKTPAAPSGGGTGDGGGGGGTGGGITTINPAATTGVSAYSPDYQPVNYIEPQPITPTNFYTDVSLGAQQAQPPNSAFYGGSRPLSVSQVAARNRRQAL